MLNSTPPQASSALALPRILCLHGGGVNADIFRKQSRTLIAQLSATFRLVFADAPFFCAPHEAILSVYGDQGPFRRWLRWKRDAAANRAASAQQEMPDAATVLGEIEWALADAMAADDRQGASGEWVGILGFSQGAKVAASLLYEQGLRLSRGQEVAMELPGTVVVMPHWRFGVFMAGRAPLVGMGAAETEGNPWFMLADQPSEGFEFPLITATTVGCPAENAIAVPTLHVHGLADEGLELHRKLLKEYCSPGRSRVIEWNGGHRIPYKAADVKVITDAIIELQFAAY